MHTAKKTRRLCSDLRVSALSTRSEGVPSIDFNLLRLASACLLLLCADLFFLVLASQFRPVPAQATRLRQCVQPRGERGTWDSTPGDTTRIKRSDEQSMQQRPTPLARAGCGSLTLARACITRVARAQPFPLSHSLRPPLPCASHLVSLSRSPLSRRLCRRVCLCPVPQRDGRGLQRRLPAQRECVAAIHQSQRGIQCAVAWGRKHGELAGRTCARNAAVEPRTQSDVCCAKLVWRRQQQQRTACARQAKQRKQQQ